MSNPFVSVIIPNYNGEKYISQAIKTVLNQTYQDFELIVVDDKSMDDSINIIEHFVQIDERVRLIKNSKNQGVSMTRNVGVQEARGEYIALLDNDDLWEVDKLERQVNLAKTGADIIYCSYDFCDEEGHIIKKPFIVPESTNFNKMLASSVISCSTCFIRTDLIKKHPFKGEFYHEDYVLWMELLSLPVKAIGDRKVLMHYRQIMGSRSNDKRNAARKRWNVYRKALGLGLFTSMWAFVRYTIKGIMKYYL